MFPVTSIHATQVIPVVCDQPQQDFCVPDGETLRIRIRRWGWFDPGVQDALKGW